MLNLLSPGEWDEGHRRLLLRNVNLLVVYGVVRLVNGNVIE